jgi:NADH:ubiquinone oxidoreductase subunit 5 (subunit L)/multisubunit Na+/H+ antiporter MnhA subunit
VAAVKPEYLLFYPIILPSLFAVISILMPNRMKITRSVIMVLGSLLVLYSGIILFSVKELELTLPWNGLGINFDLRLFHFSSFILLAVTFFQFLITLYATFRMADHPRLREFFAYVFLTVALAAGALLADNFVLLVFFWEGLLLTLFGLISLGGKDAMKTAYKSFIISGFCDFCMILGIGLLWVVSGTLKMSQVHVEPKGLAVASFILMMIGALGKGGSMPFHTWIPDAAIDAPVSMMAFLPGALEKLLGIYLLTRISLDFFVLEPRSPLSIVLMTIGAITIVLAVLMALIQKDIKKLLSFHAISQFGYMVLGIGTCLPIGIAGGIFHMLNNAIYKCGLFLSAGSVEQRTGTTELKKLGGLKNEMPITAIGFAVCALAISGIWPLNGFISKEMIFDGTLEAGFKVFAVMAWIGAIFTFASFLKAGHSIFLGPRNPDLPKVKESAAPVWIPIIVLALFSIVFGVFNFIPFRYFIEPILAGRPHAEHLNFSAHALNIFTPIAGISIFCLLLALALHFYGWSKAGKKAYLASEPIHKLPVMKNLYDWSEARFFDLYEHGIRFLKALSNVLFKGVDRTIDFFLEKIVTFIGNSITHVLQWAHNGHYANYLAWCLAGLIAAIGLITALLK